MAETRKIIFVCEHGAAKSIVAATYFNKLAQEKGLLAQALARGTNPDLGLSAYAVAGLLEDGLTPSQLTPEKLMPEQIEAADVVVSFCELPGVDLEENHIAYWHNVPAVSEDYKKARDMILVRIQDMLKDLT
ncbi:MAG: hypothetical protein ACM3XO_24105 [Bacteroidota bacterium]